MKKIEVNAQSKSYPVFIGENTNDRLIKFIARYPFGENVFAVVDSKVFSKQKEKISSLPNSLNGKVKVYKFVAKEENKSYAGLQKIHSALLKAGFGRDTLALSIGGGITGDITGFAAATFMRGIPYIQIPTTILSAVDSSVGGKTAINFGDGKNLIGAFYQPEAVFIDKTYFDSLPEAELVSGLGEIIKYSFLAGGSFLNYVKKSIPDYFNLKAPVVSKFVSESVKFKAGVVENDEREKGLRKILNLGHTFAHALEIEQQYKVNHGTAVIFGLAAALKLSLDLNLMPTENFEKLLATLSLVKDKVNLRSPNINKIYSLMFKDKKKRKGELRFVLLGNAGVVYPEVTAEKRFVINSLKFAVEYFE